MSAKCKRDGTAGGGGGRGGEKKEKERVAKGRRSSLRIGDNRTR